MIRMIFTPIGIVIGDLNTMGEGMITLNKPKILQLEKDAGRIRITDMLGSPKELAIGIEAMNYDVTDENIIKAYKESITGLTLIKTPSEVQGMN